MCFPIPLWINSMFLLLFSIQPLCVSVSDCRSECVWEGESKFFHGSSQPLAHSAAKWVTVYPLPQLRVLMCKSVNVFVCVSVLTQQSEYLFDYLSILLSHALFISVSSSHAYRLIICHHCTPNITVRGSWSMQDFCKKRVRGEEQQYYGVKCYIT